MKLQGWTKPLKWTINNIGPHVTLDNSKETKNYLGKKVTVTFKKHDTFPGWILLGCLQRDFRRATHLSLWMSCVHCPKTLNKSKS